MNKGDAVGVTLLVDDKNPAAEAWFGEARRSLTRAGVP